jgi:hypothetical protein
VTRREARAQLIVGVFVAAACAIDLIMKLV